MKARDLVNANLIVSAPVGAALAAIPALLPISSFAPGGAPTKDARFTLSRRMALSVSAAFFTSIAFAQSANDFTTRADVVAPPGASIVRAALPAASIAALRGANGGDLRVFNATGVSLPHALIDASTEAAVRADTLGPRVPALPIYANVNTSAIGSSTPTLRIEEGPTRRVIEYSSNNTTSGKAAGKLEPRGLLFDTRQVDGDVRAVALEGDLPPATIVKLTLDVSTDLKNWRTLATDAPVFNFGADGPKDLSVVLPVRQKLIDHYLRITWDAVGSPPIVALKTIGVASAKSVPPTMIEIGAPTSSADNAAEWTLSTGFRASGLRLQTTANNALMPVRILTRARAGDPWQLVASTVIYRLAAKDAKDTKGETASINPDLPLRLPLAAQLRVEALRGYSLTGVPLTLALEYPPLQVLFVATGDGPFTIATGRAGVDSAALPVATLIPGYVVGAEFALPTLQAAISASGTAAKSTTAVSEMLNRSTLLWGVLGLAVLVLGGLAIALLRAPVKR